jgi:tetratricopeptide (TPR) repeat protein
LDAAHAESVVHRDLKPQNILVDGADQIFITDFGLAKSLHSSAAGMTRSGEFLGTPRYMAPEQVEAKPVDNRTDLYAFGLILYEMVTGDIPFRADSTLAMMYQRVKEKPKSPKTANPELPDYLVRVIMRCLEVDPAKRYQSAGDILADLDAQRAPTQAGSRIIVVPATVVKWWYVWGGAAILLLAGALALPPVRGWISSFAGGASKSTAQAKAVTVLVADFSNEAGDSVFDGALESPFTIAVEGASFISTYKRGAARKMAAQLQPGATALDESVARLVAVREGINVVVSGSISAQGGRYKLGVKAIDAATGRELAKYDTDADNKEAVLKAVGKLAARVRTALGDTTPESIQLAAAETFTSGSLAAAREYAVAQDLQYAGKWQEAIQGYSKAVELDPEMGRAYAGIGALYANMGRLGDADKYYNLAFSKIDRMSEREKYRTRGAYYLVFRNPDKAIEELSELVKRFPTDTAGTANLGVAYLNKRDMPKALEAERRAVELSPKNVPQRNNLGLFAMYASDFEMGIREQRNVLEMNPSFEKGYVGLALSQLAAGHLAEAAETNHKLEKLGASGASSAAVGAADMALYEGRAADAVTILEKGLAEDQRNKNDAESQAAKLVMLAQAHLLAGQAAPALAAADKAVAASKTESVLFWTAQIYLNLSRESKAVALAAELAKGLGPDPQAEAKLITGEIQLKQGKPRDAIQTFLEARKLADTWMGRFDVGRAYLEAGQFTEAYSEFELCLKRRGEATAAFFDEIPSYRIFPAVYYYMGRAQEGLKSPAASESYKMFLSIREKGGQDPLVADAKKRLASR